MGEKWLGKKLDRLVEYTSLGPKFLLKKKYFGPKILEVIGLKFSGLEPSRHLD